MLDVLLLTEPREVESWPGRVFTRSPSVSRGFCGGVSSVAIRTSPHAPKSPTQSASDWALVQRADAPAVVVLLEVPLNSERSSLRLQVTSVSQTTTIGRVQSSIVIKAKCVVTMAPRGVRWRTCVSPASHGANPLDWTGRRPDFASAQRASDWPRTWNSAGYGPRG